MKPTNRRPIAAGFCAALAGLALLASPLSAQSASTGSIEGRVENITTGDYLNNARVSVEGTNLAVLTNQFGEYRIGDVPAGEVRVTVFYSGLAPKTETVNVTAGQRAVRDFALESDQAVRLDAFTVSSTRMGQAEIATHEQRFSANLKSVVHADSFGELAENNVAEFLKMMPGIEVETPLGQDASRISIRGMPSQMTVVTANGNQLASASSGQVTRSFDFDTLSIKDVERVEVFKTLLPDQPAEGIGGTVNIVWKSAFERSRPSLNYRLFMNFNSLEAPLTKTPGPMNEDIYKIMPGGDFTYVNPLTKNFGFTVSGAVSQRYNPSRYRIMRWRQDLAGRGGEDPYLQQARYDDTTKPTTRISSRVSFDWRFAPHDVLNIGLSYAYYIAGLAGRRLNVLPENSATGIPAAWDGNFTQGRPLQGRAGFTNSFNEKITDTWTPEFRWIHDGPVWKIEAGGAYSRATSDYHDFPDAPRFSQGTFEVGSIDPAGATPAARFRRPTIRFENTSTKALPDMHATFENGQVIDVRDVRNSIITTAGTLTRDAIDAKKTLRLNASRDVDVGIPLRLKIGGDYRQSIRDIDNFDRQWTFLGPDGQANTLDDRAFLYDIVETRYETAAKRRFYSPNYVWPSVYKLYNLFVQHPEYFQEDHNFALQRRVAGSQFLDERITSGFLRIDGQLLRNRLRFAGGVRYQHYKLHSEGPLTNTLGRYLFDDNGQLVLGPDGRPIVGTGTPDEVAEASNVERGMVRDGKVKDLYPSLTVKYQFLRNFEISGAYAETINYPGLGDLVGASSITDVNVANPTFTAIGPLRPWSSKNYDIDLAYYTPTGGVFTASVYRRDITDFIEFPFYEAGTPEAKAQLEAAGYPQLYDLGYRIRVRRNTDAPVRAEGWEFSMRQSIDPFVPDWARGLTVFFNTSYNGRPEGAAATSLRNYTSRVHNWGASYRRGPLSMNLKWNHVPARKLFSPTSGDIRASATYLDLDATYRFRPWLSVFMVATNITNTETANYADPRFVSATEDNSLLPDYARIRIYEGYGIQFTFGIKGTF